jgi:hypothetical protein
MDVWELSIMNRVPIFLLLFLAGCFASRPPPLPALPPISFDSRVGKLQVVVAPIEFVANVSTDLASNLCAHVASECGGRIASYEVPQIGGSAPRTMYIQVGKQRYPGLSPDALAGDLAGLLQRYQNIETVSFHPAEVQRHSNTQGLVIRTVVTEVAWDSEKTAGGMGSTLAGNLLMINIDPQRLVSTLGYARIDVAVTDAKTGEIIAAYPAAGTYRSEYLSDGLFVFASDVPKGYGAHMLRSALHMAFQDATQRLAQRLSERAGRAT